MGAYHEPLSDPPGYELQLEWTDRTTRRARARLVGPDGRVGERLPMGQADIVLVIPPLEPGEHRIRKDFTILGTSIRLHARIPDS